MAVATKSGMMNFVCVQLLSVVWISNTTRFNRDAKEMVLVKDDDPKIEDQQECWEEACKCWCVGVSVVVVGGGGGVLVQLRCFF